MKDMIRKYRNLSVICLAAASLLAACSEDELVDGDSLPAGVYPVEIASVAISGEGSAQPWEADAPQTRAGETGDGYTTWFLDADKIFVKFKGDNAVGTYKHVRDGTSGWIETVTPLYWRSKTKEENIIAWFTQPETANGSTMNIADQSDRLAYVLRDDVTATYTTDAIGLNFKHRLAKVRVYVQGTNYTDNATGVTIDNVPTSCTVTEGVPVADAPTSGKGIQMYKTSVNNATCFEANVLPGTLGTDNTFTVTLDGTTQQTFSRTKEQTLTAGEVFTANLRLQTSETTSIDLSSQSKTYEISDNGTYFFYGTGSYGIKVISGSPKIYLANADISVTSGNAIDITGGSPTINIQGNVNVTSSGGAGIYVSSGSVTLTTSVKSDNLITARGGSDDANVYPGIGGAYRTTINISNIYVYAYGSEKDDNYSPAIGAVQPIGESSPNPPTVNLSSCDIWAYRVMIPGDSWDMRSYADHIGQGGNENDPHGYNGKANVNLGDGSDSSSRVYCYSDDRFNGEY